MINILMGIDESRQLAHTVHINFLNGAIRSVAGSYNDPATLDLWSDFEKGSLYSDYEVRQEDGVKFRDFVANDAPSLSLVPHDVTFDDEVMWLSVLRVLVNTKSKIVLHDMPTDVSNIKDSNSTLSLVMTYLDNDKFFSHRLSGIDGVGEALDITNMVFLTPVAFPAPFTDIMNGVPEEVEENGDIFIYNKVSLPKLRHFRKLPTVMTDLYVLSKLVMLRDVLSMVTDLLAAQLFEPAKTERHDSEPSDYVSRGYVSIKSKNYRDLKKTAMMFLEELGTLSKLQAIEKSRLAEEPAFIFFCACYMESLQNQEKFYFQYKKFQSLLSILIMECKLNMFYDPSRLGTKPAWKLDYNLMLEIGGRP